MPQTISAVVAAKLQCKWNKGNAAGAKISFNIARCTVCYRTALSPLSLYMSYSLGTLCCEFLCAKKQCAARGTVRFVCDSRSGYAAARKNVSILEADKFMGIPET